MRSISSTRAVLRSAEDEVSTAPEPQITQEKALPPGKTARAPDRKRGIHEGGDAHPRQRPYEARGAIALVGNSQAWVRACQGGPGAAGAGGCRPDHSLNRL